MFIRRPTLLSADIALVFGGCVLALVIGSIGIQVLNWPPPVVSGWRGHVTPLEQNELGYRGRSIVYSNQDFVIILLGDSQVEALQCAFSYMPESRLEHYLNGKGKKVTVFSVGTGGYGQDQELLALREYYKKYRADLVVLWETPINDVWNNIFPTHWPANGQPKPTFWLENGQLMGPTEQIGEKLPYESIKILSLFKRVMAPILGRDTSWEKRLPAAYKPMTQYHGPVNYEWQKLWNGDKGISAGDNLDTEKSHWAFSLTPRSPRMEYGLELTRRLLQEIKMLVLANQGKFITFNVSKPKDKSSSDDEVYVLNGKYYRTSEKQFAENMRYINAGVDYVDLPISFKDWRMGPINAHLHEHATDEAMRNLSDILAQKIQSHDSKLAVD